MPTIVPREDANLPEVPSFIDHRSLSSWAGIRIHHTGGSFSTWRAVHDWQTEGRPDEQELAYIGYSFGIANGRVTELRGWDHHPAHDFINTHLGVVFGGNFMIRPPDADDLDALVWFIGEAERRCGKRLPISTHREVGQTGCPGDELHRWIKKTLPGRLKEDDMPLSNDDVMTIWRTDGVIRAPGDPESGNRFWTAESYLQSIRYHARRAGMEAVKVRGMVAKLAGEDVEAEVRAAIRDEFAGLTAAAVAAVREAVPEANQATAEAALRAVLGSLDEGGA